MLGPWLLHLLLPWFGVQSFVAPLRAVSAFAGFLPAMVVFQFGAVWLSLTPAAAVSVPPFGALPMALLHLFLTLPYLPFPWRVL